ncbi:extracellular solute-binding protein [Planosporangium mesophilum]|uniref:Sugar ABC transporter substrate-binding protein n=1 Tax=Planosporangium mesophilum TaxID=689768 RepID=A0A8J3TCM5_9ACTN|nr:extracellular solute-binding protein [Planosporangium mesophilum]NJC84425.1 extracellular solute-binding protein [Planosporangium mesophilum]GII23432.1 sugar ABC transporter substrate-binding protein [Planosporangium mesophilum]
MKSFRSRTLLAVGTVAALAVTSCTPGSGSTNPQPVPTGAVRTDAAALGNVTLTVWDQEVRGGQAAQMEQLNKEFQAKYPNIRLQRVSRSFDDLKTTLRLALSGNEAPDVVQANNGRSDMGEFVKAGQLLPLDRYAAAYGWNGRYPETVRQYSSYSADGKAFGKGNLYGLPQVGEVVGLFYNTSKLAALGLQPPRTWPELESAMAAAKARGEVPMMFGNLDKWPAIHVFGTIQGRTSPPGDITTLAFGRKGASWKSAGNRQAAQQLTDWAGKGWLEPGFNGMGYDPAWQAFSKGTGVFLLGGTWLQADLAGAMGAGVGFMLPPPAKAGDRPIATGGTGLPFAVTAKSKHPDAAAAYINFITSEHAMSVLTSTGNLPVADTSRQSAGAGLAKDVLTAFGDAAGAGGLVPYLDYATPTMYDTLTASLQDLLARQKTPDQFLDSLQKDYGDFSTSNG